MGIGYWAFIPVERVGIASIWWTVSEKTWTAFHEEFPRAKSRSETRGNHSFDSNSWEVGPHSSGVGEQRGDPASKQLQLIETITAQCPALHKSCVAVEKFNRRRLELRLTAYRKWKFAVVVSNFSICIAVQPAFSSRARWRWTILHSSLMQIVVSLWGKKGAHISVEHRLLESLVATTSITSVYKRANSLATLRVRAVDKHETIKERCLLLNRTAIRSVPLLGMSIGMMLLVRVGTKRTPEHLHIGSALAFRTWIGLTTKLPEDAVQNG